MKHFAPALLLGFCSLCGFGPLRAQEVYKPEIRVEKILKTSLDSAGHPIVYPKEGVPEVTGALVTIPVGGETGWHILTIPCVAYVIEGEVTVQWEDGSTRTIKAGEAFAEVVNLKHNGFNRGKAPTKLIMFAIGTTGTPIAVKQ